MLFGHDLILPWRLARRELRAGLHGFRIFIGCLTLGVAAIAAVGTISASVTGGLNANASQLLGGDIDIRYLNRPNTPEQDAYLLEHSERMAKMIDMRAMASTAPTSTGNKPKRSLVELKAVDAAYPLLGSVELSSGINLQEAISRNESGEWGAVVDRNLLIRLGIEVGQHIRVGATRFTVRGIITKEPDRVANMLSLGPRFMISYPALTDTGLIQPGTQNHYHTRLLLNDGIDTETWREQLNGVFPKAGWRVRSPREAAPGTRRFIERLTMFLTFVGLTALLVGGIGVTNAVGSYLEGKTATIATFKCLGAPAGLVFKVYLLQVLVLGLAGIGAGLVVGGIMPALGLHMVRDVLPTPPETGIFPEPLILAASFGLLSAITFALWPLGRAGNVPAATLFRDRIQPSGLKPGRPVILTAILGVVLLAALTILTSSERNFAYWFVGGALATVLLLRLGASALIRLAARSGKASNAELRLAIGNLHRPGANTHNIVLSLGLGLSVLIAVALIEGNLSHQVNERLPEQAPAFFFIDIQPHQVSDFDAAVTSISGASGFKRMPSLRGRIVKIDGVPVEKATVAPESQWAINGDRALTSSATPTEGSKIIEGTWWEDGYQGPPIISLDAGLAKGFGIGIGDTLTLNVLGREIKGTITSLREIDWRKLKFDFAIIFAPGPLEGAPHTHIAAAEAPEDMEDALEEAVVGTFSNITAIRVRDALEAAAAILEGVGQAVRGASLLTIITGALVLAGTIAAAERKRIYDSVVFKVLGATRKRLLKTFLYEFSILGLSTGFIALAIGTLTAWAVIKFLMRTDWVFLPEVAVITLMMCLGVTVIAGFFGAWRALGEKASSHLRNE